MEVVEEPVVHTSFSEQVLVTDSDGTGCISSDVGESHKPNGVAEPGAMANSDLTAVADTIVQDQIQVDSTSDHVPMPVDGSKICETISVETVVSSEGHAEVVLSTTDSVNHQNLDHQPELVPAISELTCKISDEISELLEEHTENIITEVVPQVEGSTVELSSEPNDKVTFKTEIVVERNENDVNDTDQNTGQTDELDASKNMLSALRQNLELSDVLHSDVADNMENNNSSVREEVLNKEELLDILEGDVEQADDQYVKIIQDDHTNIKTIEAQLALQQLTRLKSSKSRRSHDRAPRKKKGEKRISQNNSIDVKSKRDNENELISEENKNKVVTSTSKISDTSTTESKTNKKDKKALDEKQETMSAETKSKKDKQVVITSGDTASILSEAKSKKTRKTVDIVSRVSDSTTEGRTRKDNRNVLATSNDTDEDDETLQTGDNKPNSVKEKIVNDLVRDWEDDEPIKDDAAEILLKESEELVKSTAGLTTELENVVDPERIDGSSMDSSTSFASDSQAVNRSADESQPQRRLSRVIKKKVIFDPDNPDTFTKGKMVVKKEITDKEQPASKKIKTEVQQRPKSKSPTGKLHWKKPPPKASKQNKRLSEVDRLLMDEGAVNMIYQLTPEAPKGKKNMRTKAEFIKKIQSSTPDGKEMKFRERKKENAKEEGEAKKIVGGKRGSLSSSVKSTCEDFETHSADDSIIYRRHSSSSYSSNCMSPLRVNDQDSSIAQGASRVSRQTSDSRNISYADDESVDQIAEVFIADNNMASPSEVINKSDCLSIKQKLNSKLQNVLNKRKRDNTKTDKPAKQKKVSPKYDEKMVFKSEEEMQLAKLKNLTVKFDNNLAEITVKRKGVHYTIETLKDLELALAYINSKEDIAVTLLTSECGTLCASVDLSSLLDEDIETRHNNAICFAEAIRSLLATVEQHGKLMCTGIWGPVSGVGLAMVAMSDVVVASERASFSFDDNRAAPLLIGTAAFTSHTRRLPKPLVDNLVVFGRTLSAEEAMRGGLVSRVVWPDRFTEQLYSIAKDIAKQPSRSLLVKKQLLTINRNEKTFQSCLEVERDLLADYWTSQDGMQALRAALDPV